MCWTPLYVNNTNNVNRTWNHPTNNWSYRRTEYRVYAEMATNITK